MQVAKPIFLTLFFNVIHLYFKFQSYIRIFKQLYMQCTQIKSKKNSAESKGHSVISFKF